MPLALALNELLVNAHKHGSHEPLEIRASPDGKGLTIEIGNEVEPGARVPDLSAAADMSVDSGSAHTGTVTLKGEALTQ